MDPSYGALYRELYEKHWWWRARERAILETLQRLVPFGRRVRILDVGCGDALLFGQLLERGDVEGVEPDAALVSSSNPHRRRIHITSFDESFLPGKQYDIILMLDVLEHICDPVRALRHALSLLSPEGTIIVTVPAFNLIWTTHDDLNHHRRRYTRRTFRELARAAGMNVNCERYLFQWAFLAKLAMRAAETVLGSKPRPPRIPPSPLNRLLYLASVIEQTLFAAVPVPFGSSLLVIGRPCQPA